jgi:hypothetical protein
MMNLKNEVIFRGTNSFAPAPVSSHGRLSIAWADEGEVVETVLATCPRCGGRGGSYDSEGNWIKCIPCDGTGQV